MRADGQLTGMRGVYLVAAELAKRGFIASPTSRSAAGADILVTDRTCTRAYSLQVKTNARTFDFWLLSRKAKELTSPTHLYVLVNLRSRRGVEEQEFYVVPSKIVAKHTRSSRPDWYSIYRTDIQQYRDRWQVLGTP